MSKVKLGAKGLIVPMPIALGGANVNGRPNYLTVAYCSMANYDPPLVSISLGKTHYTNPGIKKNKTFSVNFPSVKMAKATDYCGIYSGKKTDKSGVFESFYGKLKTAPMPVECPISLECKLFKVVTFGIDELFIGEVVEVYAEDKCFTNGKLDLKKIQPMVWSPTDKCYYKVGAKIGLGWSIGKGYKAKK
jgi:flavin reductase (DIM6/NTAB) family NADH-FMN oxidoreductase RutF